MKKSVYNRLLVLALAALIVSCSTKQKANSILLKPSGNVEKQYQFDYDAARRGVFLSTKNGTLNVLSEVPPDVALAKTSELQMKLLSKLKNTDISGEMASKMSESITELGRRTIAVNILRDALFRLNAMTFEGRSLDDNQVYLFKEIVKAASEIAKQEAEVQRAKAEGEKQKLQQMKEERAMMQEQMYSLSGLNKLRDINNALAMSPEQNNGNIKSGISDEAEWERKAISCLALHNVNCALSAAEKGVNLDPLFGHTFELKSILSEMKSKLQRSDDKNWSGLKELLEKIYIEDKYKSTLEIIKKI